MKIISGTILALICVIPIPSPKAQTRAQVTDQLKGASPTTPRNNSQEVGENDVVRVTTSLVKVPVTVRDRDGRYITDLEKEDFHVYEGDTEQRIAHFGGVE